MEHKRRRMLVISVAGLAFLFVVAAILFKLRPFTYSNVENRQDYTSRQESVFATGGELSSGEGYTSLNLDVEKCPYGRDYVSFGFGHTEFEVEGRQGSNCVFSHGTEIENPSWDGSLDTNCVVPAETLVSLLVTHNGINFSPIENYCSDI